MLQELFAGVGLVQEGQMPPLSVSPRQLLVEGVPTSCSSLSSVATTIVPAPSSSPSASSSSSAAAGGSNANSAAGENLRCPRCDSTNTKFCYYNNYSLTQPRHFCKTCRRYWTKGGVLRNIPIGGGCRKAKSTASAAAGVNLMCGSIGGSSKPGCAVKISKPAATPSSSIIAAVGRSVGLGGDPGSGMEHTDLPHASILRASVQNSALMSLLRTSQQVTPTASHSFSFVNNIHNPNPRVQQNSARGEQLEVSNLLPDSALMTKSLLALDPLSHQSTSGGSTVGICSSLWYHSHQQQQQHLPQPNHMLFFGGDHHQLPTTRPLELQQWIAPNNGHYCNDHSQVFLGNYAAAASSFSPHAHISAAAPTAIASRALTTETVSETNNVSALAGGDFSQWRLPLFNLSDVSTKSRTNP